MHLPESKLIECEITLRDMPLTRDVRLTRKSLLRWLALSMGLVSPRESRTTILPLLESLLYFQLHEKRDPTFDEIFEHVIKISPKAGEKATRYHLLQLKRLGLVGSRSRRYYFHHDPLGEKYSFDSTLQHVFRKRSDLVLTKISDAAKLLQASFEKKRKK